ncbi:hypothetical protein AB0H12_03655 [Actinosynnema sp. NPDC023794]
MPMLDGHRFQNFERAAGDVTGEQVVKVVERHSSVLFFTESRVVKVFLSEPPERTAMRFEWLAGHGMLDCRLEHFGSASERLGVIVMERLPEKCSLWALLSGTSVELDHIDRLIDRVDVIQRRVGTSPVPAEVVAVGMVENIAKQARLLAEDRLARVAGRVWRVGRVITSAMRSSGAAWTPVVHGDLHSANVFVLPGHVAIIDPVFTEPRARVAPYFTELAPLYADALVLGRRDVVGRIEEHFLGGSHSDRWDVFQLAVCLKVLVRYRVAAHSRMVEPDRSRRSSDDWCSDTVLVGRLVDTVLAELAVDVAD